MTPRPVIVRGRIRDEFQCPITAQILRDPVVAKDGHTYERSAISLWLETHKTSPMTKEEISSADLVANLNLKRLIYDLVAEGGHGLAAKPTNAEEASQETAFGFDDVMVLRCLGPAESDWMNRSQVVTKEGISGGRRRNATGGKDSMVFQDTTVSRRHFEAGYGPIDETGHAGFYIQDLGSAGGTYLRLRPREAMGLRDGAMILVGKHQFIVLAPSRFLELEQQQQPQPPTASTAPFAVPPMSSSSTPPPPPSRNMDLVDQSDHALLGVSPTSGGGGATPAVEVTDESSGASTGAGGGVSERGAYGGKTMGASIQGYLQRPKAPLVSADEGPPRPLLMLKCFAPEGSPMQHRVFAVGTEGATVGRKQSNTVSLSQEKGGEVLGLDSAVSGEHCRLEYHPDKGAFVLLDGGLGGDKPSTNGTWARLSYMQMASPRQILEREDEILVGGILRFAVSFESFLMEGVVPPRGEEGQEGRGEESGGGGGEGGISDGETLTPRSKQEKEVEEESMDVS